MKFTLLASRAPSFHNFRGQLIRDLLALGYEVHLVAPGIEDEAGWQRRFSSSRIFVHCVPLQRTGLNPWRDARVFWHYSRLFKRMGPSAVLAYTVKPVVYGLLAAGLAGVPKRFALITGLGVAFTLADQKGFKQRLMSFLVPRLYKTALKRASLVFFQNPDDEAVFKRRGLVPSRVPAVLVNGSGVDLNHYALAPLPSQPVFLLVARLLGSKGVREYVAAAREVKSRHPQAQFLLVGAIDTNPDAISESELASWQADGIIDYLGRLSDVRPAFAQAQVYVLPSYAEGTPRTCLEAMAMGRPIITTNAPGCKETVIDGQNGFLVPVRSVSHLSQAMCRFIEDPKLVKPMGARSREIAEEKFDVHKVNKVMLGAMGLQ